MVENDTSEEIVIPELSWRYLNQTHNLVSYVRYPSVMDPLILKEDCVLNALVKCRVESSCPFSRSFFDSEKKKKEMECYGVGLDYYMVHSICRCESRKVDEVSLDSVEEKTLARKELKADLKKILHRSKIVENMKQKK